MTGTGAGGDRHIRFAYDNRNELTEAKWYNGINPDATTNGIGNRQFTYHFDCIGNRTDDTGDPVANTTLYTSNVLNQYASTTSPSETFFYDDDGNLTQDGTRTYQWDAENRLTGTSDITLGAQALKIQYKYDYLGRRVRKTTYTAAFNGFTWNWNVTPNLDRKFVYDGWNLIEELNALSSDTPVCKYTWGLDLSGQNGKPSPAGIHGAGGIGGLLGMYDVAGSKGYIYCFDANGNVCQLVNSSSGAVGAQYEYYAYGGELVATGSAATINPFRLSTKYWDGTANLLYFGYRYLKPKMGRWLNRDPIGERGGRNLYALLRNSPTDSIDPLGLCPPGFSTWTTKDEEERSRRRAEPPFYQDETLRTQYPPSQQFDSCFEFKQGPTTSRNQIVRCSEVNCKQKEICVRKNANGIRIGIKSTAYGFWELDEAKDQLSLVFGLSAGSSYWRRSKTTTYRLGETWDILIHFECGQCVRRGNEPHYATWDRYVYPGSYILTTIRTESDTTTELGRGSCFTSSEGTVICYPPGGDGPGELGGWDFPEPPEQSEPSVP